MENDPPFQVGQIWNVNFFSSAISLPIYNTIIRKDTTYIYWSNGGFDRLDAHKISFYKYIKNVDLSRLERIIKDQT